ncbi:uncharacterized protein RJT21DRAFT_119132, partial [Scheffersomyces amazonensis]|uniref:uncharacterized protein n=1 Tax=Scheffersomyces amazonensis TaxID=1078765 RepID=UPI00315D99F4
MINIRQARWWNVVGRISHPYSSTRIWSRRYLSNSSSVNKTTSLNYDPSLKGDFINFGILPFLQGNLNRVLLPDFEAKAFRPEYNAGPSDEQMKMLAVLNSNISLILKGNYQTGKSLGLLTYVINRALIRVPNYAALKSKQGIESIIILPSDELIEEYRQNALLLLDGSPEDCAPNELIPENVNANKIEYNITRRPLNIKFVYSSHDDNLNFKSVQTGSVDKSMAPQILVTKFDYLYKMIKNDETNDLKTVEFIGVDEFDYYLKVTDLGNDTIIDKVGVKERCRNLLEFTVKKIQALSLENFKHTLNQNESNLRRSRSSDKRKDHNVVYKPLQFCFLSHAEHPHKLMLNMKDATKFNKESADIEDANTNEQLLDSLDIQKAFIEKMIRFNNEQRLTREKERSLVFIEEGFSYPKNNRITEEEVVVEAEEEESIDKKKHKIKDGKIEAYFISLEPQYQKGNKHARCHIIRDIDVEKNKPINRQILKLMDDHIEVAQNASKKLKVFERDLLKFMMIDNDQTSAMTEWIRDFVYLYRLKYGKERNLVIVLPSNTKVQAMIKELNEKKDVENSFSELFEMDSVSPINLMRGKVGTNYIATAPQLLGINIHGMSDIAIMDFKSLIPQTAFMGLSENIETINGITDPYGDLLSFYLSRLLISPSSKKKRIFFNVGSKPGLGLNDQEYQFNLTRLGLMLAYNNMWNLIEIKKFNDPSRSIPNEKKNLKKIPKRFRDYLSATNPPEDSLSYNMTEDQFSKIRGAVIRAIRDKSKKGILNNS